MLIRVESFPKDLSAGQKCAKATANVVMFLHSFFLNLKYRARLYQVNRKCKVDLNKGMLKRCINRCPSVVCLWPFHKFVQKKNCIQVQIISGPRIEDFLKDNARCWKCT